MNQLTIYLLLLHFIGDFVLQTDEMAQGKSKCLRPLLEHVGMYGLMIMGGLTAMVMSVWPLLSADNFMALIKSALVYSLVNTVIHGAIDFVTSRVSAFFWREKRMHDFFVVIGFDQLLHAATLIGTIGLLK